MAGYCEANLSKYEDISRITIAGILLFQCFKPIDMVEVKSSFCILQVIPSKYKEKSAKKSLFYPSFEVV